MKLTAFTDYSLRVLIWLAAHPGRRTTIAEIAHRFGIKENHLTKVVHHLARGGWVETVRGKGGGLSLARPPEDIGLGDVVRYTEGHAMPAECFAAEPSDCPVVDCCQLQGVLAQAVQAFYRVLDRCSLADITSNRDELAAVFAQTRGVVPIAPAAPASRRS